MSYNCRMKNKTYEQRTGEREKRGVCLTTVSTELLLCRIFQLRQMRFDGFYSTFSAVEGRKRTRRTRRKEGGRITSFEIMLLRDIEICRLVVPTFILFL